MHAIFTHGSAAGGDAFPACAGVVAAFAAIPTIFCALPSSDEPLPSLSDVKSPAKSMARRQERLARRGWRGCAMAGNWVGRLHGRYAITRSYMMERCIGRVFRSPVTARYCAGTTRLRNAQYRTGVRLAGVL